MDTTLVQATLVLVRVVDHKRMNIKYMEPIDGEEMANISEFEINQMGNLLYEVRKKRYSGDVILSTRNFAMKDWANYAKKCTLMDRAFVIRVFDEDKLVAFRFMKPLNYSAQYTTEAMIRPKNEKQKEKYKHISDWVNSILSERNLNYDDGLGSGHMGTHIDYNYLGISTRLRNLCNDEARKRGFTWGLVCMVGNKLHWDWVLNYYSKNTEVIMSDIKCPNEFGGYGNLFISIL